MKFLNFLYTLIFLNQGQKSIFTLRECTQSIFPIKLPLEKFLKKCICLKKFFRFGGSFSCAAALPQSRKFCLRFVLTFKKKYSSFNIFFGRFYQCMSIVKYGYSTWISATRLFFIRSLKFLYIKNCLKIRS